MLGMLLDDVGPIPVVSTASASTSQAPGCGITWQVGVTWSVSIANDRHWQIDVYSSVDGGAFTLFDFQLSTTTTSLTDNTGFTSDGTIGVTHTRAYIVKVVARGQSSSIANTSGTGTVSQNIGNAC